MAQGLKARFAEALKLQNSGQPEAALAQFTAITMEWPDTAEAHFQIGRIHAAVGRLGQARDALVSALKIRPEEPAIWAALNQVVPADEREDLADALAVELPAAVSARLGVALRTAGRLRAAETLLAAAVAGGAEAARLPLAQLYRETCRVEEAERVLDAAKPKSAEIWMQLALIRARMRRVKPAQDAMAKAARGETAPGALPVELSGVLAKEDEGAAAKAVLTAAIKRHPKRGALYGQRGQVAQSLGALDEAEADLRKAIALDPTDGEAFRSYFAMNKAQADDPLLAKAEAALRGTNLPPEKRLRLHYAMAKALSDLGRHDEVFNHLHKANALQKKQFPFDFDQAVAQSKAILQAVRRDLSGVSPVGAPGKVIFVAGLPRSGTTLVESVLAAHPQVSAGGELPFMVDALRPVAEKIERGLAIAPVDFAEPGARYLRTARRRLGGAEIFTDKSVATPYRIGLAAFALPDARFILPRRDPRDVGFSIYRNMFAGGQQRFSTDLFSIGRMIRLHDAMVAAWAELFPERVHFVEYEALTEEPESAIRAMIGASGLPWDEACLAPHLAKRRVETLSFAQVRQPIYRSSVAGWRRYEDQLGALEEGLAQPVDLG